MHTVICAFDDRADAQRAMDRLIERGFSRDMVHLQSGREGVTASTDSTTASTYATTDEDHGFFHSIGRFFSELFGGDDTSGEAGHYAEAVRRGSTVLVVDAVDEQEAERARSVMNEMGGTVDLEERASQWRSEGWTGFDAGAATTGGTTLSETTTGMAGATTASEVGDTSTRSRTTTTPGLRDATAGTTAGTSGRETVMPVVQEELQVGKREIEKGGVRVIKRVSETPVKEMVRLREERAVVERRPADRPATEADLSNLQDRTVEVRETAEEPVVAKTARVVEEVVVGKDVQERTETVSDTVRRTDVEVEKVQGEKSGTGEPLTRGGTTDEEIASRTR